MNRNCALAGVDDLGDLDGLGDYAPCPVLAFAPTTGGAQVLPAGAAIPPGYPYAYLMNGQTFIVNVASNGSSMVPTTPVGCGTNFTPGVRFMTSMAGIPQAVLYCGSSLIGTGGGWPAPYVAAYQAWLNANSGGTGGASIGQPTLQPVATAPVPQSGTPAGQTFQNAQAPLMPATQQYIPSAPGDQPVQAGPVMAPTVQAQEFVPSETDTLAPTIIPAFNSGGPSPLLILALALGAAALLS